MENIIFRVKAGLAKTLIIKDDELWLHGNAITSIEKFALAVNRPGGILKSGAQKIPLISINEISFNELSDSVEIRYLSEKEKQKKLEINFEDVLKSNEFGKYLGRKLGLKLTLEKENKVKPVLLNIMYLLFALGGTYYIGTMDDTSDLTDSSRRKGRAMMAIIRLIVETVGPTGVFIIGGLTSVYLLYRLYNRFKNPSNEFSFRR